MSQRAQSTMLAVVEESFKFTFLGVAAHGWLVCRKGCGVGRITHIMRPNMGRGGAFGGDQGRVGTDILDG